MRCALKNRVKRSFYGPTVFFLFLFLFCFSWCDFAASGTADAGGKVPDWTSRIERLGVPHAERYPGGELLYARNIWTMKAFQGKLYFGAGAYDNSPPAANAGPVPIFSFDPKTKTFENEWTAPDEQISVYRIFSDGALYAPGIDPREGWNLGNFYRKKKDGEWEKVRTFPKGVHNLDMEEFDGKIFCGCYGIGISNDWGETMILREVPGYRVHSFLRFPNALFAASEIHWQKSKCFDGPTAILHRYDAKTNDFVSANQPVETILPETLSGFVPPEDAPVTACLKGSTPFKDRVLFHARRYRTRKKDGIAPQTFGAYSASFDGSKICVKRIHLPEFALVRHFAVVPASGAQDSQKVCVLFSEMVRQDDEAAAEEVRNHVWISEDGIQFAPLFTFTTSALARSLEYLDGYFYFGLGTNIPRNEDGKWTGKGLKEASGEILRIPFTP